jgi:hypothetical protein
MRTVDDHLTELLNVVCGDGFGEGELASEDGRDTDLIRLDVDVGRDDGTGGVVDTLSLRVEEEGRGDGMGQK